MYTADIDDVGLLMLLRYVSSKRRAKNENNFSSQHKMDALHFRLIDCFSAGRVVVA